MAYCELNCKAVLKGRGFQPIFLMTHEKILMQKFSFLPGCRNQAFLPKDWVAGSINAKKPGFEASEVRPGLSVLAKRDYTGRDGQNRDF